MSKSNFTNNMNAYNAFLSKGGDSDDADAYEFYYLKGAQKSCRNYGYMTSFSDRNPTYQSSSMGGRSYSNSSTGSVSNNSNYSGSNTHCVPIIMRA